MHNRLMKYLDEVARCGSFRAAGQKLNVAASAVQRQIVLFEEEIGTPVFERSPKGLHLTSTGELVLAHIRETLRNEERMMGEIRALGGTIRQTITIASQESLISTVVCPSISQFQKAHPAVKINVMTAPSAGVANLVSEGKADLALAYEVAKNPRFVVDAYVKCRLGVVVRADHPLSAKTKLNLAEISGFPLVLAARGTKLRSMIAAFAPIALTAAPIVESDCVSLMLQLVATGRYMTLLCDGDVREVTSGEKLVFIPLVTSSASHTLALLHAANRPLKPVQEQFEHVLIDNMQEARLIKE